MLKTIEELDEMLLKTANVVGTFLIKNGGLSNGFQTYASGYVCHNVSGSLKVRVNNDDLSLSSLSDMGNALESKLKDILAKYKFKGHLQITASQRRSGTFETAVKICRKQVISLLK